jgi:hypothetical protein
MTVKDFMEKIEEICEWQTGCEFCPFNQISSDSECFSAAIPQALTIIEKWEKEEDKRDDRVFEYKGYTLVQSAYNNHYMIYDETGKMVMHCQHEKKLSEKAAQEQIEFFIEYILSGKLIDMR